jgi:hypothetical protein
MPICARFKTLDMTYFMMVLATACFKFAWEGLVFNSGPYQVYKYGDSESFNNINQ